jgi:hypothetical protein
MEETFFGSCMDLFIRFLLKSFRVNKATRRQPLVMNIAKRTHLLRERTTTI